MAESKSIQRCCLCDKELNDTNAWTLPERFGKRFTPYCIKCQPRVYDQRAATVGYKLAMFLCAAEFNMPYMPDLFKAAQKLQNDKTNPWAAYTIILCQKGYHKGEKFGEFADGVTDIKKAFDGKSETLYVDDEMLCAEDYVDGRVSQEKKWGKGPTDHPYTREDYDKLDRIFAAIADNRPAISSQTQMAIEKISRWTLEQDFYFYNGDPQKAKLLGDLIKSEMENEQLRKKDELPQDLEKLDGIVRALEAKGLLGTPFPELLGKLHPNYQMTKDAAEQILLAIYNTSAWNEGRAEVASLPPSLRLTDELGEFMPEPDEAEKEIYRKLDLIRGDDA